MRGQVLLLLLLLVVVVVLLRRWQRPALVLRGRRSLLPGLRRRRGRRRLVEPGLLGQQLHGQNKP